MDAWCRSCRLSCEVPCKAAHPHVCHAAVTKSDRSLHDCFKHPWCTHVATCCLLPFIAIEGDILILDNSHVTRPYGDVIFELLWILPRLKRGVFVHLHDIFLPWEYPAQWMLHELRPYTEQYMLAAFL